MPFPGTANNPAGINDFSGPLGETEPAYGTIERDKALASAVPVSSPPAVGAPRRAQRRAARGGDGATPSPPQQLPPQGQEAAGTDSQQQQFWTAVLSDPGASPLARAYATKALGG